VRRYGRSWRLVPGVATSISAICGTSPKNWAPPIGPTRTTDTKEVGYISGYEIVTTTALLTQTKWLDEHNTSDEDMRAKGYHWDEEKRAYVKGDEILDRMEADVIDESGTVKVYYEEFRNPFNSTHRNIPPPPQGDDLRVVQGRRVPGPRAFQTRRQA
jgi:hypothetical protein